jgi:membrane-associated phospholipid phosphatase
VIALHFALSMLLAAGADPCAAATRTDDVLQQDVLQQAVESTPAEAAQESPPTTQEAGAPRKPPGEPKLFLQDVAHVATGPLHWKRKDWLFLGGAVVGLGVLSIFDEKATRALTSKNTDTFGDKVLNVFEPLGAGPGAGGAAAVWVYGVAFHDQRGRALGFDLLASDAIATTITEMLKVVVGRGRPNADNGSFSFRPGRSASFPSGHATQAFAFAAVLSSTYENPWITGAAYGAAGLVGLARIRHEAHFATDVAAGALIGTATGLSVVHLNKRQRNPETNSEHVILSAVPSLDGRGAALVFVLAHADR